MRRFVIHGVALVLAAAAEWRRVKLNQWYYERKVWVRARLGMAPP